MKIIGDKEFNKKLQRLKGEDGDYQQCLDEALDDTIDLMHHIASSEVPVKSGDLRKSLNVRREWLKKTLGTSTHYAAKIEYGTPEGGDPRTRAARSLTTSPLGPKPYMRPAFQEAKDGKAIKKFLKECIDGATK